MLFKLPKLNLLVDQSKTEDESSPTRYIHVINGHAIVNNDLIVCVNLREYVKKECDVQDDLELDRLSGILAFMEGKSFTPNYWKEFVKEVHANLITEDTIEVEHVNYNAQLVYEEVVIEKDNSLNVVADNLDRKEEPVTRFAINHRQIEKVSKAFAQETRNDTIVFSSCGQDQCLRFTMQRKDYIFGVLPMNYDSSTELTSFLINAELKDVIKNRINL